MKTYTIQHGDITVTIESAKETKFDAIDKLIMSLYSHYRDHRPGDLDQLMKLLNAAYDNLRQKK